jgi:hypothetical protein
VIYPAVLRESGRMVRAGERAEKDMLSKIRVICILLVPSLLLAAVALGVRAQPGGEADPVVSLSYLEKALAYSPVVLEGGEDFPLAAGRGIILVEGACSLLPPSEGRGWIVDLTDGVVADGSVALEPGHMYLPLSDGDRPADFVARAVRTSVLAVPGGVGRVL